VTIETNGKATYSTYIDVPRPGLASLISSGESVLWTFGFMVTIIFMGAFSPVGAIIATVISLVVVLYLGLFTALTTVFLTVVIVLAIIVATLIKKRGGE